VWPGTSIGRGNIPRGDSPIVARRLKCCHEVVPVGGEPPPRQADLRKESGVEYEESGKDPGATPERKAVQALVRE